MPARRRAARTAPSSRARDDARGGALTHVDARGRARMVDVGGKPATARRAPAEAFVSLSAAARRRVRENSVEKGDVLATARLAGIAAAKRTADLIPLCHPLRIVSVRVEPTLVAGGVRVEAEVLAHDRTGVEMEALTAAAVAALTVYDMTKAIDRGAVVGPVRLLEKEGGRSGLWTRPKGEGPGARGARGRRRR